MCGVIDSKSTVREENMREMVRLATGVNMDAQKGSR